MLDIQALLDDAGVPYWDSGKNVSQGWISISCPMGCGDRSNHGAFSPTGNAYSCFKCGSHSAKKVISTLTSWSEAKTLLVKYSNDLLLPDYITKQRASEVEWPPVGCKESLPEVFKNYLIRRQYDPDFLETNFDIRAVYQVGDFKYRIIVPVYLNGKLVTYIGRDITDKAKLKYKNLKEELSILPVKETVYNIDNIHEEALIFEGVTDTWRFAYNSVSLFGLVYTQKQVRMLGDKLKKAYICFDSEVQAQIVAEELAEELTWQGVKVEILSIDAADPGELNEQEANEIKRELF